MLETTSPEPSDYELAFLDCVHAKTTLPVLEAILVAYRAAYPQKCRAFCELVGVATRMARSGVTGEDLAEQLAARRKD